jgi:hypothetical protein
VGYQDFTAIGNTNTTFYGATDASGNWESGLGTYSSTGPTLTRTTVYASSNSGSAVTFSGTVNVFCTYPSSRAIYEDASGNVSALGTITSGVWNGSTIPVAYGGTGVTASSGASSVVLRDANQNVIFNNFTAGFAATTASAGTTVLTVASARNQILVGSTTHTYQMPDATTLQLGQSFLFVNNSSGVLTITNNASATIDTIPSGGVSQLGPTNIGTSAGTFSIYSFLPGQYNFNNSTANFGTAVITNATYQGETVQSGYGGTGLTTFTAANGALYSTSASALAAGTLPVAAGGTGTTTTPTNGQLLIGNGTNYSVASLGSGTGISTTTGSGTLSINNTGVTSNVAGTGITVSGATGAVTISIGQAVATSSNVQFNSLGVGTAGSATAGEIRATNNITAYYSDIRLKTKVGDITDPLGKVRQIETMLYHANETAVELGYDASVIEVGLSAQSVQAVQPEAVAPAPIDDKYLTVRYERLVPLLLESVKALEDLIIELEAKLKG